MTDPYAEMWHSFVSVDDDERWQLARGYHDLNTRRISVSRHARSARRWNVQSEGRRALGPRMMPTDGRATMPRRRGATRSAEKGDRGSMRVAARCAVRHMACGINVRCHWNLNLPGFSHPPPARTRAPDP